MIQKPKVMGPAVLLAVVFCQFAQGQQNVQTNLVINLQNAVEYQADISRSIAVRNEAPTSRLRSSQRTFLW